MSKNRDYMREYMRKYREMLAAREGRQINPKRGRPRIEAKRYSVPEIYRAPGWPTKEQLMAGR